MNEYLAMDRVIHAPKKHYTRDQAQQMLHKYGVLTANNTISEAYRHVVIVSEAEKTNGSKQL